MLHVPRRTAALAVVLVATLTACGSGSDDAETVATDPVTTAVDEVATTEPADEAADDTTPETSDAPPDTDTPVDTEPAPDTTSAAEPSGPRVIEHAYGTTEVPADPQRIVALSEEFLLADLLALGITPVASSSNESESFGGIDPALTEGIEIMTSATFNIERLAAFRPDLIIAYPIYIELVGYAELAAVAPTVAIGDDDSDWRERLEVTAEVLGVEELGAERIAAFEERHAAAREVLEGRRLSVASIFDPTFIRAYTDERTFLVQVMVDAGVELVPEAASVDGVDAAGRIQLSLEQLGLLQGDILVLLQRIGLEDAGVAEIAASPLWQTLRAVENDAVITLDRLGYPGAEGAASFATDLAEAVAALS